MNQQPVPAPEHPGSKRKVTGKSALVILGLVIVAALVGAQLWESLVSRDRDGADSAPDSTGVRQAGSSGTHSESSGASTLASTTSVTRTVDEEQDVAQRLAELQRIHDDVTEQLRTFREQDAGYRVEQALQSVRLSRLRDRGNEVQSDLQKLKTQLAGWETTLSSLMTSDTGRKIGSDPDRLRLVASLLEDPAVTEEQIDRWEKALDLLLEPLDEALSDEARLRLPDDYVAELDRMKRTVRETLDEFERRQASLNSILSDVRNVRPESSAPTLQAALQEFHNERTRRREQAITEAVERVEEEYTQKLAEERARTTRVLREAKLEREKQFREMELKALQAGAEIEAAKIADAMADAQREEEQRQAEREAQLERETHERAFQRSLPEIRRYLVPFITPGNQHLAQGEWIYTEEKKPFSLSAIHSSGAMENNALGHQTFMTLAASRRNDRPNGVFPGGYFGGHIQDPRDVVRAQNLLKEFGDLLVEREMLEP